MKAALQKRSIDTVVENGRFSSINFGAQTLVLFQRIPGSENLFICSFTTSQAAMIGWLVELFLLSDINQYPFFPPLSLLMNVCHPFCFTSILQSIPKRWSMVHRNLRVRLEPLESIPDAQIMTPLTCARDR